MAFQGMTMPGPYMGLDLVSPIDNMDPAAALELVNIFPGANVSTVRLGYEQFADTGSATPIKFVEAINLANATTKLVASNDTTIYGIDTAGVVSTITGSTVTSGEWQSTTYNNRIYLCNGVDKARYWNGSAATTSDLTFTGLALTSMVGVHAHKERLYFIENASSRIWYGGLQVTGTGGTPALTSFDLSYVMTKGGYVVAIGSYSNNTSMSVQDLFWACSSEGEIVFYSGSYAGDPTSWGLVARYYIGKPLGRRAFVRVNNDVWVITEQGIVPLSGLFQADPESALDIVSKNINPLISETASQIAFDHQWHGFFWPQGRRVYITLPQTGTRCTFLVYSIDRKAWTQFQLFNPEHCLSSCLFNRLPFYASATGIIWQGETGQADATTATEAQAITYAARLAFSFYGSRANYKAFKDIRPIVKVKRGVSFNVGLDTDFKRQTTVTAISSPAGVFTPWGSPWGVAPGTTLPIAPFTPVPAVTPPPWSAEVEYVFDRFAVKGQGHCAAIRFGGSLKNTTMQILGFEVRYDMGGQV
jgi:hypothetical protein